MSTPHKFVFFGTPRVASETLILLIEHGFVPALVVTSPDAPKGRGLALTPSPMKTLAIEQGISVLTPSTLDADALEEIRAYACDYALVVAYGKIFPESLIAEFPKGVLNVHYSLLPKYRGATPLETALLVGESETGVTIQKMVKELDAGDILAQESTLIGEHETAYKLRPRLIKLGAELLALGLQRSLELVEAASPEVPVRRPIRVVERTPGRGDSPIHVDGPTIGHGSEDRLRGGVDRFPRGKARAARGPHRLHGDRARTQGPAVGAQAGRRLRGRPGPGARGCRDRGRRPATRGLRS